jgi:transposase InsO family protein
VPLVPDGRTIAPTRLWISRTRGTEIIMPDNGICERFHKTLLDEFYRVAFRKKVYRSIEELQTDLDAWLREYNETRPH